MKRLLTVLPLVLLLTGCSAWFSKSHLGSGTATAKSNVRIITPEERSTRRVTATREYLVSAQADAPNHETESQSPLPVGTTLVRDTRVTETEAVKTSGINEQLHEGTTVTPKMDVLGDIKDVKPPEVNLPSGVSATGGTFEAVTKYLDFLPRNTGARYVTLAGIGLLVVGVCLIFIAKWGNAGWPLAGLGAVLLVAGIAFETAPWIAWVLAGVVCLVGLVALGLYLRTKTGAGVIIEAIETLPADVQAVVKAAVLTEAHNKRAETAVNATVDKAKE